MDIDFSGCVSRLLIEVNKLWPLQLSINVTAAVFYLVFVCQISSLVFFIILSRPRPVFQSR